jgi:peptide deformylase
LQLQLRFYGDPILRKVCDPVTVFDADLRAFAEAMIETMFREQGIGLAGPQVGVRKRVIVALRMRDPEDAEAQPVALVNPKVTSRSRETWIFEEGCLSLPEIRGEVMRVERATVHYQDLEGKAQEIEAEGMFARILLHEIDHLDGRLFIDYLSAARKSLLKPKLREIASRESA